MHIRKLCYKDADFMLEWMHEKDSSLLFRFDTMSQTRENVLNFIDLAQQYKNDIHLAVADENDEYLGTVSLKNINYNDQNAEYAISMRACARGTGAASFATEEVLKIAFEKLKLHKIYLNVVSDNLRAIHFYEKYGFVYEGEFKQHLKIQSKFKDLKWYRILHNEFPVNGSGGGA